MGRGGCVCPSGVSHVWENKFKDTVAAIKEYLNSSRQLDAYIWFDLFSLNQWRQPMKITDEWLSRAFEPAFHHFRKLVAVFKFGQVLF